MKCIKCGTDNKLKDRTANQGRCQSCKHPFVFEPTAMQGCKVTDPMFAKLLSDISVNNTLAFTTVQLRYLLDNRLKNNNNTWIALLAPLGFVSFMISGGNLFLLLLFVLFGYVLIAVGANQRKVTYKARRSNARNLMIAAVVLLGLGVLLGLVLQSPILYAIGVIGGMLGLYQGFVRGKNLQIASQPLISLDQTNEWLARWQQVNGEIPSLLQPSNHQLSGNSPVAEDVTTYSFDRLVVCDSDTIAQFLIANNFHFENNCAILSIDRYPANIFDTVMTMVRRNPDLKVFAVHDCSPKGLFLPNRIQSDSRWFANEPVTIIDVGILPRQILAAKRGFSIEMLENVGERAKQLPSAIKQTLSPAELAWLEQGHQVLLESIAPQMLLTILQRAIAKSQTALAEEFAEDSGLLLVGSNSDYFLVDSFG
jgi:hypothetical protein